MCFMQNKCLFNKQKSNNSWQMCERDKGLPTERRFAPVSVENRSVEKKPGKLQE